MMVYFPRSYSCIPPADFCIDSSSDDDFGPALPSAAPKKKRRKLPYEKLYISALPTSPRYSKSLMHKDQLSFVTVTPFTEFLITSSVDGVAKFWKKIAVGIESVKEFKAHVGEIKSVSVSQDGRSFATAGADKTIKIFDVITFGTVCEAVCKDCILICLLRSACDSSARFNTQINMLGPSAWRLATITCCLERGRPYNQYLRW